MKMLHPSLDFICVGAPKAGTTSLYYALKKHPKICFPRGKEMFYLVNKTHISPEDWKDYFREAFGEARRKQGMLYGTISPVSWMDPGFPDRLKAFFPNVKVLIVLRNPAKRFVSHYNMLYAHGAIHESFDRFLKKAFEELPMVQKSNYYDPQKIAASVALSSMYAFHVDRYRNTFGDRLLIVIFERLITDPHGEAARIFRFLEISPVEWRFPKKNYSSKDRRGLLPWLAEGLARMMYVAQKSKTIRRVGRTVLRSYRYSLSWWVVETRKGQRLPSPVSRENYQKLVELLRPEVNRFYEKFGQVPEWAEDFPIRAG